MQIHQKSGSLQQLQKLVLALQRVSVPWIIIGRGSNIVVSDTGVSGVVIVLGTQFSTISIKNEGAKHHEYGAEKKIHVEAGCSLTKLVTWCRKRSLGGLEFVAGIPGSVGGAVIMNAGAWGHEIKDVLYEVDLMTDCGEIVTERPEPGDFEYRKWKKKEERVVVGATLLLSHADPAEIDQKCHGNIRKRNEKQPKGVASAGSFFKNPEGFSAGLLIEKAGLKGETVGGAQVSQKHANFLVNTGRATAQDFYELMKIVQKKVFTPVSKRL